MINKSIVTLIIFLFLCEYRYCKAQCQFNSINPDPLANISLPRLNGTITLRVNAHIIADASCSGGLTEADVKVAITRIASDLEPFDICISLHSIDITCDDNLFYNSPTWNTFNSLDAFDIIFLPVTFNSCCGAAQGTKASILGSYDASLGGLPTYLTHTVSHEFGHCLGLAHTFQGGVCDPSSGVCRELVNGSNSSTCGDYVTDTPADPCMTFHDVDPNCSLLHSFGTDANGDPYNPDPTNIMSYTYPNCGTHFTAGQGQRMRDMIQTHTYLQACIIPDQIYVQNFFENSKQQLFASPGNINSGYNVTNTTSNGNVEFTNNSKIDFIAKEFIEIESGLNSLPLGGSTNQISGYFNAVIDPNYCSSTSFINNARISKNFMSLYHPLLDNTVWLSTLQGMEGYESSLWTKENDTVMNGLRYTKIHQQYIDLPGIWNNPFLNGSSYLYLREDTIAKIIYQCFINGTEFKILDFSLQIGDTLPNPLQNAYILTTIDSILTNQGFRKRFVFNDTTAFPIIWVEGIGNLSHPFDVGARYDTSFANILCVHKDGILIYEFQSMFSVNCNLYNNLNENIIDESNTIIYPNPTNSNFYIEFPYGEIKQRKIEIYDLTGRLLDIKISSSNNLEFALNNLDNGIYFINIIIDGKKYIKLIVKE